MLNALKFVQGAVARKDLVPALTHFLIRGGRITGFNGSIALSSPIALDLDAAPRATPFIKAIQACEGTTAISVTNAGRLAIKSDNFKAFIECTTDEYPETLPEGENYELDFSLLEIIREMMPFVGQDASRPWSLGLLLRGQSALATNNIILIEKWMSKAFPCTVNIPAPTLKELLRIKEDPVAVQMSEQTITFHYADGRWLKSNIYSTEWPDFDGILAQETNQEPIPDGFFEALETLKPFVDAFGRVLLRGCLTTSSIEGDGAMVELEGIPSDGCYNLPLLLSLSSVVKTIDFSAYPSPCIFYGELLRGAMVGMTHE